MTGLVVATDNRFWRRQIGSQVRIYELLFYLYEEGVDMEVFFIGNLYKDDAKGIKALPFTVHITGENSASSGVGSIDRLIQTGQSLRYWAAKLLLRLYDLLREGRIDNTPLLETTMDRNYLCQFREYLRVKEPQAVLIQYLRLDYLLNGNRGRVQTFLDTHDVSYTRFRQFKQSGQESDLRISKRRELKLLSRYNAILAIQQEDYSYFRDHGLENVILTPHPVKPRPIPLPAFTESLSIGFLGSAMAPNIDGMNWFLRHINERLTNVTINIYGSVCSHLSNLPANVNIHGFVENIESVYRENHLMINPVRYGGGLKIKTLEALSFGRAILSTRTGNEGMPADQALIYCHSEQDWIDHIDKFRDSHHRVDTSKLAVDYIHKYYSHESCFGPLLQNLQLAQAGKAGRLDSPHQFS